MKSLNRPQNINTTSYWDEIHKVENRSGWWTSGLKRFIVNEIQSQAMDNNRNYIECGSGAGLGPSLVKAEFPELNCYNVDFSVRAIELGKQKYPELIHICYDVHYPFAKELQGFFDILICQELIEHLENPSLGIQNMMMLLKAGGFACFTFPYNEGEQDGVEHLWSFDYSEIRDLFMPFADEITICKLVPPSKYPNLWGCIKFWKT